MTKAIAAMFVKVRKVRTIEDHRLELEFSDGTRGVADVSRLFERYPALHPLREAKRFMRAYVEHGAVAWPGDIDIAPELLYALITRGMKKSKTEQREPSAASLKDMPEVDLSCAKLNPYVRRGITRGMTNNDAKDPAHRGETRVSPDEAVDIDDEEDK